VDQLQRQNVQPEHIPDGQELPHIKASEGLLRLVIDEIVWVKTNERFSSVTKPPIKGRAVTGLQFNATAQDMLQPSWYKGPNAVLTKSYIQDGQAHHKQLSRSVVFAAADTQHDGWFSGISSYGLRHSGLLQKVVTSVKGYQEFVYTHKVGDVSAYNPDNAALYGLTKGVHQVITRSKVAAAILYVNP
jgi:hypothetical protein